MSETALDEQRDQQVGAFTADARRRAPRYEVSGYRVWVSWRAGTEVITQQGIVQDISKGGMSVLLPAAPPADGPIWVRLYEDPMRTDSVMARVASMADLGEDGCRVGI